MTWLCAVGRYVVTGYVERRPMVTMSPTGTMFMHVTLTFIGDLPSMPGPVLHVLNSPYSLNLIKTISGENTGS